MLDGRDKGVTEVRTRRPVRRVAAWCSIQVAHWSAVLIELGRPRPAVRLDFSQAKFLFEVAVNFLSIQKLCSRMHAPIIGARRFGFISRGRHKIPQ